MAEIPPPSGSNIPNIPPKSITPTGQPAPKGDTAQPIKQVTEEVKGTASSTETTGSTEAAKLSAAQIEAANALKAELEKDFGKQVADDAMSIITSEMKSGKKLTYELVQQAVLKAAEKNGVTVDQSKLGELPKDVEEIQPPPPPPTPPQKTPEFKSIDYTSFYQFLNQVKRGTLQFKAALADNRIAENIKQGLLELDQINRGQIQEQQTKRDPSRGKDTV